MLARPLSCALCIVLVSAFAGRGVAQDAPAPADEVQTAQQAEQEDAMSVMDEEARQHFKIGKSLYDAGRFVEAAAEFDQAYKKSGRPQLLYNLYVANRDASHWAQAVEALRGYLEKVPDAPDRINLRARLKSMEDAAGRDAEQQRQADAEAERQRQADAAPKTRTEKVRSLVPVILMGVGGALAVGGGVTALLTKSKTDDLEKTCAGNACPENQSGTIDSAQTLAITTDVLLGAGLVTAGVGVILFFTGALDTEREVPVASLSCGPTACGATLTGRF